MGAYDSAKLPSPPGGRSDGLTDEDGIAPDGLPGIGGLDGFGGFGRSFIEEPVGRGQTNRPEDVFAASSFLQANEFMDLPIREPTEEFHRGIEAAQTRLNELSNGGLRVDGYARPFGPTEVLAQRAVTSGHMAMPGLATMTAPGPEAAPRPSAETPTIPVVGTRTGPAPVEHQPPPRRDDRSRRGATATNGSRRPIATGPASRRRR